MGDVGIDLQPAGKPAAKAAAGKKDPHQQKYDVFISYRRSGGSELAALTESNLRARGYSVFLDVDKMPPGKFDQSLARMIKQATDVVVVLTPGSLDRRTNQKDWFFEEISLALEAKKNVVPFRQLQYELPLVESLPESFRDVCQHHCATYIHGRAESSFDELCRLLHSKPRRTKFWRALLTAVFILVVGAVALWNWGPRSSSKSSPPQLEIFQLNDGARTPVAGPALLPDQRLVLAPHVADGMLPYILELRGDGTAKLFSSEQLVAHQWQWQIDVPRVSETILLLASDHTIADPEKEQIEKSITDLALKPKVAMATQTLWSPDGARSVKTMDGARGPSDVVNTDWQARLLSSLQSLKGVSFGGVSLPIMNTAETDGAGH